MTIASEISRLQGAKADICTAIENKGVTVGNIKLDQYCNCINAIPSGVTPRFIDVLIVGGGGSGGPGCNYCGGGGGGGGGYWDICKQYVSDTSFNITVGCGGASASGGSCYGNDGCPSCVVSSDCSTVLAVCGGGRGSGYPLGTNNGSCIRGGSGGGAVGYVGAPNVSIKVGGCPIGCGRGNAGGSVSALSKLYVNCLGGGGGGACCAGCPNSTCLTPGHGGNGCCPSTRGCCTMFAGGGGGGGYGCYGTGTGGGGNGGCNGAGHAANHCGGGGGGGGGQNGCCYASGAGKGGIVMIKYPVNGDYGFTCATGGSQICVIVGGITYKKHTFCSNGTFTIVS